MNIVQKLTLRHIRTHMKRSVLTALAIVVSVAMVTAVFTTLFSFLIYEHESALLTGGTWHAQYLFENAPDLDVFRNDPNVKTYTLGRNCFDIVVKKGNTERRAAVDAADENTVGLRALRILEGAFPSSPGELLVSRKFLDDYSLGWKVGDTVSFTANAAPGEETETLETMQYRVCGVADPNVTYFDSRAGIILYDDSVPVDGGTYVTVEFSELDRTVFDKIDALTKKTGALETKRNSDLFSFSGIFRDSGMLQAMVVFVSILLAIIVIASVAMIYDSFAVSYQERERYLGMLASVGATKKQKRASIYFEGLILSAVAIPVGLGAGFLGMEITFRSIQTQLLEVITMHSAEAFRVRFSPWIILGAVLTAAFTVGVSCYIPARKASKTSPIDAIRGANTVKVKKAKRLRVSRLTRKLFGYEGELAVKNFKRNGRRSRNIVFALVMSAALFLTVSNFSTLLDALMKEEIGGRQADFTVFINAVDIGKAERILRDEIDSDRVFGWQATYCSADISDDLTAQAQELLGPTEEYGVPVMLFGLDNATFDAYVKQLGADASAFHGKSEPRAVLYNLARDTRTRKNRAIPCFENSVRGTKLHIRRGTDDGGIGAEADVEIALLTEREPEDFASSVAQQVIPSLIVPFDTFFEFESRENGVANYGVIAGNYEEVERKAEELLYDAGLTDGYFGMYDNGASLRSMNATFDIIKVFVYGFITLITLIAVINIVNSVANSMNERRREFAMLRSVGLTPGGFKKMVWAESLRYGAKSLLFSLPLGLAVNFGMYLALDASDGIGVRFSPNPLIYLAAALGVFAIIAASLLYSADKLKDDGIIENLKEDI
ncbi:MAG: ABC transporter permease [Clostridia bacterium]|nr:ABC transporter permease [Clostridia bacterium]